MLSRLVKLLLTTKPGLSARQLQHLLRLLRQQNQPSSFLRFVKQHNLSPKQKVDYAFLGMAELRRRLAKAMKQPGLWEQFKQKMAKARQQPSLREQWRRAAKWKNVKEGLKTLGWEAIKQQLWAARNQSSGLRSQTVNPTQVNRTYASAKKEEQNILMRLLTSPSQQASDSAMLSSSWLYSGTWQSFVGQDNYWEGVLFLTVYQGGKCSKTGKIKQVVGKTYTYSPFPLAVWVLMKMALGRCGTGAGTVFWRTYLRGFRASNQTAPYRFSEQVILPAH